MAVTIADTLFEPVSSNGMHVGPLSKNQLTERIIAINPSATTDFLNSFGEKALKRYLEHLTATQEPRGRTAWWLRPGDSPAIVARSARD